MRFSKKTVVVTGSASGIGAQTVRRFAQEGANVVVADINGPDARAIAASIPGSLAVEVDVSSKDAVRQLVDEVQQRFGAIDVLINNAMSCSESPFLELSPEEITRDITVSLIGPMFMIQEALPGMLAAGGGVILNVTSINGLAYFGNEAYSAAKAGLVSLTQSIAVGYGRQGVRCNAVAPGTVATGYWGERKTLDPQVHEKAAQWYPLGRVGEPDDVADALMFLASDAASWVTGVTLPVEGGILAGNLEMTRQIVPQ